MKRALGMLFLAAALCLPSSELAAQADGRRTPVPGAYTRQEIFRDTTRRTFTGASLAEIAFPLGGIGAGNVSLGGYGQLRDWEIFNRPAKGRNLPYTFFALWVREEGRDPVARVLEARRQPPYARAFGLPTGEVSGLPRMASATFRGEYPMATVMFEDRSIPLLVTLEAFTPFIPLDARSSSMPAAVFRWRLQNPGVRRVEGTLAFSLLNAVGIGQSDQRPGGCYAPYFGSNLNQVREEGNLRGIFMTSRKYRPDTVLAGSLAVVTTHPDVVPLTHWERAGWWDDIQKFWDDFRQDGVLEAAAGDSLSPDGRTDVGTLGERFVLEPGTSTDLIFVLAWHFPLRLNYWDREPEVREKLLRNWYATEWPDAWSVAREVALGLDTLERSTRMFHDALFSGTAPWYVLDAASSQASIMATLTGLRLDDGKFYAFEGCGDEGGCCPMNCTHVWNYEQAVAFLFPELERSMRETDFLVNTDSAGKMVFRTKVPTGAVLWNFRAAADGQLGTVMKLYREWRFSGDGGFLRSLWPAAKRALEYAWTEWDKDLDGVLEGEQHNTYDIEFSGKNTMTGCFYLGALRAGEEMARAVGDAESAVRYRMIYERGRAAVDRELFNGEYYIQLYDTAEAQRYQYGTGCLSDQLLGQWFANVAGLGPLLDTAHIRRALASIFRYNWRSDFSTHNNVQRVYALNDEKGLVLCSWPKGGRPALPFVYSDEVWTGIEYQVAAHLIQEGMLAEGLSIVLGVRERYNGERRNPWNEVECGNHYARAMSSWSLLTALSGVAYDGVEGSLSFAPHMAEEKVSTFFSSGTGWGVYRQDRAYEADLELLFGRLTLRSFGLPWDLTPEREPAVELNGRHVEATLEPAGKGLCVRFREPLQLRAGDALRFLTPSKLYKLR